MDPKTKKTTFTLPTEIVLYLQTKENQTAFVAEAIKKAKKEEEATKIKVAAEEMEKTSELWEELGDWDVTLNEGIND